MTSLIVGYGRAGQRHARYMSENTVVVDPYVDWDDVDGRPFTRDGKRLYSSMDYVLGSELITMAVIATPPELHIEQARRLIRLGIPTLVEKPICGLGQLDEARVLKAEAERLDVPLGAAYNYRYHPVVNEARAYYDSISYASIIHTASQYRELPYWGLLLDHASHSLDIIDYVAGIAYIDSAVYYSRDPKSSAEKWLINGQLASDVGFILRESIDPGSERHVEIDIGSDEAGHHEFAIGPNDIMFSAMWQDWVNYVDDEVPTNHRRILFDTRTQKLIEDVYKEAHIAES